MIEYELAGADLGEVRFAISPLNELVLSLRALKDPGRFPLHLPWLREVDTAAAAGRLDLDVLLGLTNELLWTPDFLNLRPRTPLPHLDRELETVAATPPAQVAKGLTEIHPERRPKALADLIGTTRTRLLVLLASPGSSTELAVRLGVTTTAVNQHLRAMRAAGLLSSARHGRSVLYRRSDLGDRLVGGSAHRQDV